MNDFYGHVAFEPQEEPRGCGAACLAMAYRALGRHVPQADIWPRVARRNEFGSVASATNLMARDAIERGFAAVAAQARAPLEALRATCDAGAHAILSTRLAAGAPEGHYALLLDIDAAKVALHDPLSGPRRLLTHAALDALWGPAGGASEIAGHVLIAVANAGEGDASCGVCRAAIPASLACPRCEADIPLRPSAALGCMTPTCAGRLWERLCCPGCDLLWGGEAAAEAQAPPARPSLDLARLANVMETFAALTLAAPGASAHPEMGRLIAQIAGLPGRLRQALAADAQSRAALAAGHAAAARESAERVAAIRARAPKPPPPSPPAAEEPPLDADALGRALLDRLAA